MSAGVSDGVSAGSVRLDSRASTGYASNPIVIVLYGQLREQCTVYGGSRARNTRRTREFDESRQPLPRRARSFAMLGESSGFSKTSAAYVPESRVDVFASSITRDRVSRVNRSRRLRGSHPAEEFLPAMSFLRSGSRPRERSFDLLSFKASPSPRPALDENTFGA